MKQYNCPRRLLQRIPYKAKQWLGGSWNDLTPVDQSEVRRDARWTAEL